MENTKNYINLTEWEERRPLTAAIAELNPNDPEYGIIVFQCGSASYTKRIFKYEYNEDTSKYKLIGKKED